jgi:hypothetical protein
LERENDMNGPSRVAARRGVPLLALGLAAITACTPAQATLLPGSWNGWTWSHTGKLNILLGDNVSSAWDSYLRQAATSWSADKYIDFQVTSGMTSAAGCSPVYGTVQACSGNYGATGWLGYATVWTSGTKIVEATVKLNDYYFSQTKYNVAAFRLQTTCQEVGHTIGLAHLDTNFGNANLGSCMDYTNDPTGTKGTNGTKVNTKPTSLDFTNLDRIYAKFDTTQLPYTKPGFYTGDGLDVPGSADHESVSVAVPEPSSWTMMIVGFSALGLSMRRGSRKVRARA